MRLFGLHKRLFFEYFDALISQKKKHTQGADLCVLVWVFLSYNLRERPLCWEVIQSNPVAMSSPLGAKGFFRYIGRYWG